MERKNTCFKQNTLKPPRKETLMHEEHAGDWPILVNFLHHGITALAVTLLAHAVATAAVMLAGSPVGPVVHALARALGGGFATSAVGVLRGGAVMGARLQLIGIAHGFVTIIAAIHNSEGLVVGVHLAFEPPSEKQYDHAPFSGWKTRFGS